MVARPPTLWCRVEVGNMREEWRAVSDWPYEVSSLGRVRKNGRVLTQSLNKDGYPCVKLYCPSSKPKTITVHLLVCTAFHGPRPGENYQCRHYPDNARSNNCATNLSWGTSKQDAADRLALGTQARGERNGRSKLDRVSVRSIIAEHACGVPKLVLARKYGVTSKSIRMIIQGTTWGATAPAAS